MARVCRVILLLIFIFALNINQAEALRIISLYPGHTDNIIALGCEDYLIGVSENDNLNLNLQKFSPRDGAEKFLALKPDIVITRRLAERLNPTLSDVLRQGGVKVFSLDTPGWSNFEEYLIKLANILEIEPEQAVSKFRNLINNIKDLRSDALSKGKAAPRVFVEATSRELNTCAPDSWAAHLIELAGGINIASQTEPLRKGSAIAPFGLENILKNLNNINIYIIQQGAMNTASISDVKARPWGKIFDMQNIKLIEISEGILSRPSLLGLEEGGKELLKIFYDL